MNKTDGAKKAAPRYLRNDVILIFAVLLVATMIGLLLALTGKEGDTVTVTASRNGEQFSIDMTLREYIPERLQNNE